MSSNADAERKARAAEILRSPWWKQILMGVGTAVPHEWVQEDGSLKLAGESAAEFMDCLEKNNVKPTVELLEACNEYVIRRSIEETGEHPNGVSKEAWQDTYE